MRRSKFALALVLGVVGGLALALVAPSTAQEGGAPAAPAEDPKVAEATRTVAAMRAEIERLSPRRFSGDVGVAWQTEDEFRAFVVAEMEKEYPPEVAAGTQAAWVALGLLPEGTDLRAAMADAVVSQAAAYYLAEKDTFFIVKADLPKSVLAPMILHELQHAMQDQRLGLDALMTAAVASKNGDQAQAARFVFEGEANWLMSVYAMKQMGIDLMSGAEPGGTYLRMQADMPFDQLMQLMKVQAGAMGPSGQKMMDDTLKIPRFIIRGLFDAYNRGQVAVHLAYHHGGWEAVDALFKNPPTSTEQMLHPKEKLFGDEREEPVSVPAPDLSEVLGEGWIKVYEDTLGEGGILILLTDQLPAAARATGPKAAAGWGGDRFAAWALAGSTRPIVAWLSVWDAEAEAAEFAKAYGAAATPRNTARNWPAASVEAKGTAVAVVEGADGELAAKLAAALLAAAPK